VIKITTVRGQETLVIPYAVLTQCYTQNGDNFLEYRANGADRTIKIVESPNVVFANHRFRK